MARNPIPHPSDDYQIIEEALCARTISSDDPREGFEGRNGLTYAVPAMDSHWPIDLVIVMLDQTRLRVFMTTMQLEWRI